MVELRILTLKDLNSIIDLRLKLQNYDLKYKDKSSIILSNEELKKKTTQYVKENLNKTLFLFGLFIDDVLISNAGFYLEKHFPTFNNKEGYVAYICNVYTKEEYRKKGYQKKVLNYVLKSAKEKGITKFQLDSLNEVAINLYKEFGFNKKDNIYELRIKNV